MKSKATIIKALKTKIGYAEQERKELLDKLVENYNDRFAWDGEVIFKLGHEIELLKRIIDALENSTQEENLVESINAFLTKRVLDGSGELMERSTSHLHSLSSLWEKEIAAKMLSRYVSRYALMKVK